LTGRAGRWRYRCWIIDFLVVQLVLLIHNWLMIM
jgi:hypothetical protein